MAMVDLDPVMVLESSQNLMQHKTVTKKDDSHLFPARSSS